MQSKSKKFMKSIFIATLSLSLVACTGQEEKDSVEEDKHSTHDKSNTSVEKNQQNMISLNTKNVTRLDTSNPIEAAIGVSQMIWPSTHNENKPGTVILAPLEQWQISLASTNLIHHPNNGPVLFYDKGSIPEITMKEIQRLNPVGNVDGTQIMVMGNLGDKELALLDDFKLEQVSGESAAEFARDIDFKYAEITGETTNGVIIVSLEEEAKLYSILAGNWIAHMPEPILYVNKDEIPEATKEALSKRNNNASIYVLGPETVISNELENALNEYGIVTRISGETPTETALAFAQFKDNKTNFGWGVNEPGHGLEFVSTSSPEIAIVGAPFAHLGKHAPLIWLAEGVATGEVHDFLNTMQPTFTDDPTVGPYTHVYLLGSTDLITYETQGMIDLMIEISPESGNGHHGH